MVQWSLALRWSDFTPRLGPFMALLPPQAVNDPTMDEDLRVALAAHEVFLAS